MSPTLRPVGEVCSMDSALDVHRKIFTWINKDDRRSIGCVRVVVYDKSMEVMLSAETMRSDDQRGWWDFEAISPGSVTFGGMKI